MLATECCTNRSVFFYDISKLGATKMVREETIFFGIFSATHPAKNWWLLKVIYIFERVNLNCANCNTAEQDVDQQSRPAALFLLIRVSFRRPKCLTGLVALVPPLGWGQQVATEVVSLLLFFLLASLSCLCSCSSDEIEDTRRRHRE